jgi:hypothetical protein
LNDDVDGRDKPGHDEDGVFILRRRLIWKCLEKKLGSRASGAGQWRAEESRMRASGMARCYEAVPLCAVLDDVAAGVAAPI